VADAGRQNWLLRNRILVGVVVIVLAAMIGYALTQSSKSPSTPSTTASTSTPTSTSSGACASGGSCGYDNVSPAEAVQIIANQTTGPGSLKDCTPTTGEVAALKSTGSSEWNCINVTSGASGTYTINADGSVDY